MRCSKCGSDNREGAKFCNECGTLFGTKCTACDALNKPKISPELLNDIEHGRAEWPAWVNRELLVEYGYI